MGEDKFPLIIEHKRARVKIYRCKNRKAETYSVNYSWARRRRQKSFANLAEAKAWAKETAEKLHHGLVFSVLEPGDANIYQAAKQALMEAGVPVDVAAREYASAAAILDGKGTLNDAVTFWKAHAPATTNRVRVEAAVAELLDVSTKQRKSKRHIDNLRMGLAKFTAHFPQRYIDTLTTAEIEQFLLSRGDHSSRTINNLREHIVRLFAFGKGRWLPRGLETTASQVGRMSAVDRGEVQIFTPDEMDKLLSAAGDRVRPCIALGGFAGIRNAEICRMDWSAIKWEQGVIELKRASVKQHRTAARRIIPLADNLRAWLMPLKSKTGPITTWTPVRLCEAQRKTAVKAKVPWKQNALRHSYGSYRLAVIQNIAQLALEMGNSPREIIENYREAVTPAEGKAWFGLGL